MDRWKQSGAHDRMAMSIEAGTPQTPPFENPPVSVIIPAYNEAESIERTIKDVKAYFQQRAQPLEIIVAADGDDGTRAIVAGIAQDDEHLHIFGSIERRGKGFGIRRAVERASGDIVGYVDADNKTPISEFEKFEPWLNAGYELVIGSRAMKESIIERAQPLYRRLGSKGFAVFMHAVVGLQDIPDTQCGFKFFQASAAKDLFQRQVIDGYMFDVEILYLAQKSGYRIVQVPVRWRDDGDSRLELVRGNLQNAFDIFRIRFNRSNLNPEDEIEILEAGDP
jgi:dolichyl-phosphate beta-glucosyltransferase